MPIAHPPCETDAFRPEIAVNPVFTREPVAVPRFTLPERGLDGARTGPGPVTRVVDTRRGALRVLIGGAAALLITAAVGGLVGISGL